MEKKFQYEALKKFNYADPIEVAEVQEPPRRRNGLFEVYLESNPAHILEDARKRPEAYTPEAMTLLAALYESKRDLDSLSPIERHVLEEASLEFLSPSNVAAKAKELAGKRPPATPLTGPPPEPEPVTGLTVDPFWWTN